MQISKIKLFMIMSDLRDLKILSWGKRIITSLVLNLYEEVFLRVKDEFSIHWI